MCEMKVKSWEVLSGDLTRNDPTKLSFLGGEVRLPKIIPV